ncbi:MAG: aminotransferase class I/II-fold pyridoxal phosphate-dependent enzyme, partial [Gemmobacter sp.]
MAFNERFANLPAYAFPRLRALLDSHAPGGEAIAMTIGEPKHPAPDWLGTALAAEAAGFSVYPPNEGAPELLAAIAAWIARRDGAAVAPERIMAANGTREALFNACIALCPETKRGRRPIVAMPNPFYPVYGVAALACGAEPLYLPATRETGFLPDW